MQQAMKKRDRNYGKNTETFPVDLIPSRRRFVMAFTIGYLQG